MDNIWNVCQDQKAEDMYNNLYNKYRSPIMSVTLIITINTLSSICSNMIEQYNQVVTDEQEYLIEVENIKEQQSSLEEDIQAQIEQLKKEIEELEQKDGDGTITDDERKELKDKRGELNTLVEQSKDNEDLSNQKIDGISSEAKEKRSKEAIASDYGNVTVKKGSELAKTGDSVGTLGKILSFGLWTDHSMQRAGEAAVKVGDNLLGLVHDAKTINNEIDNKKEEKK